MREEVGKVMTRKELYDSIKWDVKNIPKTAQHDNLIRIDGTYKGTQKHIAFKNDVFKEVDPIKLCKRAIFNYFLYENKDEISDFDYVKESEIWEYPCV